jgi:exosortase family protein XrtF
MTIMYQSYLSRFDVAKNELDGITKLVSEQAKALSVFFNYDATLVPNTTEAAMNFSYKNKVIARIIEGCNGVSVIILFISFVVAFSGKIKVTLIYILGGSLLIYILNVIRIAVICILMYYYPEQQHLLHDIFFPLIIYGVVFVLWIIWVNTFSKYARKTTTS